MYLFGFVQGVYELVIMILDQAGINIFVNFVMDNHEAINLT
jgi:hypothetical protein